MAVVKSALEDPREITALVFPGDSQFQIGSLGVTKIIAYTEPGQAAPVLWFAVYHKDNDWPTYRVNGVYVDTVKYKL